MTRNSTSDRERFHQWGSRRKQIELLQFPVYTFQAARNRLTEKWFDGRDLLNDQQNATYHMFEPAVSPMLKSTGKL